LSADLSDFGEPFHFLEPLAAASGDPERFDESLLDDLVIEICRVEPATCVLVKTLTSASSTSERLRIGPTPTDGSFYLANWDTGKIKLSPYSYRVSVSVAGLELGSIVLGQQQYKSFGRTWPIKFLVENHPTIRVRVLRSLGQSASQVANVLRNEFDLGPADVAELLASDIEPYSAAEIELALAGVFQPAVVPETTEIADQRTQEALVSFDPGTGTMAFSATTPVLDDLDVGDVLVGEPTGAAPNGYLRKVASITKQKRGGVVIETSQALINDVVNEGTLDAAGDLEPDDIVSTEALPGVTLLERQATIAGFGALDIGDGYSFHETFDVTINGAGSDGGVSGNGTVRIQGEVKFNAGYNVGFGVEECLAFPPVCVDRFEAHLGVDAYSDIQVTGNFNGQMQKEYVLSIKYFKPIVFFIGPVPVVLVPIVKAIAGVTGDAHLEFSFEAKLSSRLELGAKWTDPGDGGIGWEDLTNNMTPTGTGAGDLEATMELRAYAKTDAKLLLYGIAGPGLAGRIGVGAKVQYPGNPLWEVFGHARGEINFAVDLGGILKLSEHVAPLPEFKLERIAQAENQPPVCGTRMDPIPAAVDADTYLGPQEAPLYRGYFSCSDPEGDAVNYSATFDNTPIDHTKARWSQPGTYDVVITASDQSGTSRVFTVKVAVNNTPPILEVATATGTVPASVQYFVTAAAWDVETEGYLPCSSLAWTATGGTVNTTSDSRTCTALVVFDQVGSQTVKVVATDKHGKSSEQTVTVNVTTAPVNPAPVIDPGSFAVFAETGPFNPCNAGDVGCDTRYSCPSGAFCRVPYGAILYNGAVGSFRAPLTVRVSAADPNGDGLSVMWHCTAGLTSYPVIDNGDGTSSCSPYSASITVPIEIWVEVSDGVTTVRSGVQRLYMLDRVG
jgi:hypothetical protein